jgi:hypothetical protein
MSHPMVGGAFQQRPAVGGVVSIVLERISDRFRYDRLRCEMHDRIDIVIDEQVLEQRCVTGVADDEFARGYGLRKTGGEVVQREHRFSGLTELPDDMAADVTGAAGHEYCLVSHSVPGFKEMDTIERISGRILAAEEDGNRASFREDRVKHLKGKRNAKIKGCPVAVSLVCSSL